ncbi:hypothetical protein [Peribacillus sp. TH14]
MDEKDWHILITLHEERNITKADTTTIYFATSFNLPYKTARKRI